MSRLSLKLNYIAVVLVCLTVFAGARPMLRGYPLGSVTGVDKAAGVISVDLGAKDGVVGGMSFTVVDEKGRQVASVTAGEVYNDLFWSGKLPPEAVRAARPGMQVRWVFTPEVTALLNARKQDTVEGYRDFISRFPASRFVPELVRGLPDPVLRELDREYYAAWKRYTKEAFRAYADKHPGTGFAKAAEAEIRSIESFEAAEDKARQERAKRAADAEAERKRREEIEQKARTRQEQARKVEFLGRVVNNSDSAVRFVFDPPSEMPQTTVTARSFTDARHPAGSFTYKVYKVEEGFLPSGPADAPQPLKEGTVDIQFDFWEVGYP